MPASSSSARPRSPRRTPERTSSHSKDKASSNTQEKEKRDRSSSSSAKDNVTVKEEKHEKERASSGKSSFSNATNRHKSYSFSHSGKKERKFTGRCRLFVGNLVNIDETELKEMFEEFGEVSEVFVNHEKGFGFIRLVRVCPNIGISICLLLDLGDYV